VIVLAIRASTILYNLLVARADRRPFLLPANICPIVPLTFFKAGISFAFVDISPGTLNMDLAKATEWFRSGEFGGLLYAHTYGDPLIPEEFFSEIKRLDQKALVIDDRCLCLPDLEPDAGSLPDVLLYSTSYAKFVDLGFGGYAYLRPETDYQPHYLPFKRTELERQVNVYKGSITNHAPFTYQDGDWLQTGDLPFGWESYQQQIRAAIPPSMKHRQEINAIYTSQLPAELQLPARYQLWRFNLRIKSKQKILDAIFTAGLFASAHYSSLAGIMAPGFCPEAEKLADGIVNLFNDGHYTEEMAGSTCQIILQNL